MEIIIGMALAFVLGAYVRKPFEFKQKTTTIQQPIAKPVAKAIKTKEEQLAEEFFNAMSYTGKPKEEGLKDETKA